MVTAPALGMAALERYGVSHSRRLDRDGVSLPYTLVSHDHGQEKDRSDRRRNELLSCSSVWRPSHRISRTLNIKTWNRYAYVMNNPLSFIDPLGLLLKGPVSTCAPGDTSGIVCDGGGGGGGSGSGGGGGDDSGVGGMPGSAGLGSFCDASGNCSGIPTCPDGYDDSGSCLGGLLPDGTCLGTIVTTNNQSSCQPGLAYVGGTTGFGAITLPGAIQFGAAAFNSSIQTYLTALKQDLPPPPGPGVAPALISVPFTTSQDLAFLTLSAPTLSPITPVYQPGGPAPKPPNPCKYFPNMSCFPKTTPNAMSLQFFTMGDAAMSFWDLVP